MIKLAAEGFEPANENADLEAFDEASGPTSGPIGADLRIIITSWPHLTEQARRDILRIVRRDAAKATR